MRVFEGEVALGTGAGLGLGRVSALAFAKGRNASQQAFSKIKYGGEECRESWA